MLDKKSRKRQWKKLKLVLDQESYVEVLNGINRINNDLEHLIVTSRLAPSTPSRIQKVTLPKKYRRLCDYANNLYGIFSEKFRADCPCPASHVASLPLQIVGPDSQSHDTPSEPRLKVLFHFSIDSTSETEVCAPWKWHTLEFEPMDKIATSGAIVSEPSEGQGSPYTFTEPKLPPTIPLQGGFRESVKSAFKR